jgi:nitrate reductase gamma subunit
VTKLLWGVYPYIAILLFLGVPILRMSFRPFSWSTRASSMFSRSSLGVGSLFMHWGLLLVLIGHLSGLFGGVLGSETAIQVFYWTGLVGGAMVVAGSTIALVRRFVSREVRAMSQWDDYVVHLLLIPIVTIALYQVIVHRIFGIAYTASAWAASLWTLTPQPELMASASLLTKLHVFLALTFLALFPFTKLVHAWTYPVNYFVRPYQSVRTQRFHFQRKWELAMRSDKSWLVYGIVVVAGLFVTAGALLGRARTAGASSGGGSSTLLGSALYVSQCARCHGVDGRGDGAGAGSPTFGAPPRDLSSGRFHFVSTETGAASREDLAHVIRNGLPSSGMPAFEELSETQVQSLVDVILGIWGSKPDSVRRVAITARPALTSDGVERGASLYASNCAMCHGPDGRGDGPVAAGLTDASGNAIRPANLAAGALKAGRSPEQLYYRITAGVPDGPGAYIMPSYRTTLEPDDTWAIVTFLESSILPRNGSR